MNVTGTLTCVDWPHYTHFSGSIGTEIEGTADFTDSSNYSPISGYVISDSTRLYPDYTFTEGDILGRGNPIGYVGTDLSVPTGITFDPTAAWADPHDPPLYLMDHTYFGGYLDGTTHKDGTWMDRWYDPIWINYALWYVEDASNKELIGIRDRQPVRINVGNYYTSMVVPNQSGKYEIRWRFQKDNSSYAREAVEGFLCKSSGIDPDRS